ncbi:MULTISPECIES: nucleoside triphosphate pyrophosphohydrolase [Thalassospira]|jgi:tetrapyrrole methylase family protein/MazG family protein/ATP diphosphatase|uniref:Nucleoside triphosphate hydrolase n=1 Tax=Thalassospira xiamenensis TaxID=220697 RepID=A0ABR5Y4C3_9PROT|nr:MULTISPECIES: nucleoside triphosphate pyrophosphohydrolase [Thalassospira]MAL28671.1 nucleoside triphosphate pyrophosphohydrolase [Thalassospira sp.]MBR9779366.1 nucleoside triphosphate pyrophosphohydrolase [Rhodospirillales bacterium]KZD05139.1 nucleoside triphosphate hydrolase [Thalassospira xiamenensis]KZD11835.1 nucleoside triphosphate hydrolase [Thalassospira xiamenensis]MBL4841369.1 nucleoside triphosphate pyrophosphohydrolase [Thalassospira sp.]|tara:strand:+ start:1530 stop:2354 length:825 start_codon:yes stop_codon:yes gene_type:complete
MANHNSKAINALLDVMARLRDPDGGCPWDLEQNFATIAPYTIEEAYEVADAIAQNDMSELREELGDLLLQVVFHSQMATEEGHFTFEDVANSIVSKMIDRHPHVFGDGDAITTDGVNQTWEKIKAEERAQKAKTKGQQRHSALDGVASALPALMRAEKLTKRAARVGFDWPSTDEVFDKLHEEIGELQAELTENPDQDRIEDELGDMLFVMANLSRKLGVDPEVALRRANHKFTRRFHFIENELARDGRSAGQSDLEEMDALWNAAKQAERNSG